VNAETPPGGRPSGTPAQRSLRDSQLSQRGMAYQSQGGEHDTIDPPRVLANSWNLSSSVLCDKASHIARALPAGEKSLLAGVPMSWDGEVGGIVSVVVTSGKGAHFSRCRRARLLDLCLGDTARMTDTPPDAVAGNDHGTAAAGVTFHAADRRRGVGRRRSWPGVFGLPYWQV